MGGSDGTITFKVAKGEKGSEVTFQRIFGKAKNKALNSFLFAIPNDMVFAGEKPEPQGPVREIEQRGFGPDLGQQFVIIDEDGLAKAFTDRVMAERVRKQVVFAKERLVSIAWWGGADSKMTHSIETADTGPVVVFTRHRGGAKNLELNTWLFAVANDASFRVEGYPEPPADKTSARRLDLTGIMRPGDRNAFGKPTRITDKEGLANAFPKSTWQDLIDKQVDFTKERLLLFAWSGSGGDRLSFKVNSGFKDGKEQTIVAFRYQPSDDKSDAEHLYLFAVPYAAVWSLTRARPAP